MSNKVCCRLCVLMGAKRVTIQDIHLNTGLSRNTIANLYYDRATRIDYETINKLCDYFNCEVGDLLKIEKADSES